MSFSTRQIRLVPTERHVEAWAARAESAITLRRLIARLADARLPDRRPTTPEMTRLLTSRLLGVPQRLCTSVDDALGGLRRAGVAALRLRTLGIDRANVLAEWMDRADAWLERARLRDERGDAWLAAAELERGLPEELERCERVVLSGITRWESADVRLWECLHAAMRRHGRSGVTFELPPVEHFAVDGLLEPLVRRLEERWSHVDDAPALVFAAKSAAPRVEIVAAQHAESEARAVARAVLDGLARGVSIDAVAIVSLDLSEAFLEPLRAAFAAAKIPFSEPRGRPAIASPQAHSALELLRLARGPLSRDILVDLLKTPDLRPSWFEAGRSALFGLIRELERLPLRVDRTGSELSEALTASAELEQRTERQRSEIARAARALGAIMEKLRALGVADTRARLSQRCLAAFEELGFSGPAPLTLRAAVTRAADGDAALLRTLSDDARGMLAVATAFERVAQAATALGLDGESVTVAAFVDEVEAALPGVGPSGGAARAGAVHLGRPSDIAGLGAELVVVCRASSAHLDSAGRDSLLSEELLSKLPIEHRPLAASDANRFIELGLAWSLASARQVVVTYSGRDERGNPDGASRWVRALGPMTREEPASALHPAARRVTPLRRPTLEAARRAEIEKARLAYFLDPGVPAGPHTGVAATLAQRVGGATAEAPLSVTLLERYLRCPFLGFAAALRAVRDEQAGDAIGIRERGTLLHAALARALTVVSPLFGSRSSAELERIAMQAAQSYLDSLGTSPLRRAGLRSALSDVRAFVRWSLDNAAGYLFREAERGFGAHHEWPSLALANGFFAGRIDRIDVSSDGKRARVIDYKSGSPPSREEREHQLLQPWLYALEVKRQLGVASVESGYLSLSRRQPEWVEVTANEAGESLLDEAIERAEKALVSFRAGRVEPRPSNTKNCLKCDARDICRRPLSAPAPEEPEG